MLLLFSYYKILAVFPMLYNTVFHLVVCASHYLTPVLPFSILPAGNHPFILYMCNNFFLVIFTSVLYFLDSRHYCFPHFIDEETEQM